LTRCVNAEADRLVCLKTACRFFVPRIPGFRPFALCKACYGAGPWTAEVRMGWIEVSAEEFLAFEVHGS
jgi:hypothetical protein